MTESFKKAVMDLDAVAQGDESKRLPMKVICYRRPMNLQVLGLECRDNEPAGARVKVWPVSGSHDNAEELFIPKEEMESKSFCLPNEYSFMEHIRQLFG